MYRKHVRPVPSEFPYTINVLNGCDKVRGLDVYLLERIEISCVKDDSKGVHASMIGDSQRWR